MPVPALAHDHICETANAQCRLSVTHAFACLLCRANCFTHAINRTCSFLAQPYAVYHAVQVATTATFAACGLEALRMLLADLEQPGGTLINPVKAPMHLLLPVALKLVPTVLPAGAVS